MTAGGPFAPRPGDRAVRSGLRPTKIAAAGLLLFGILEILVIILVGRAIGPLWTILLLVATSLLGAWLVRREGSKAFSALRQAVQSGRMPARELADGMLVLVGGVLLSGPGFVSDVLGLLLVLPFTRPVARNLVAAVIARRMVTSTAGFAGPFVTDRGPGAGAGRGTGTGTAPGAGGPQGRARSSSSDEVIEGEIIADDPPR